MGLHSAACCCCQKKQKPLQTSQPSQNSLKVLAAQTLKIASINGLGDTEKLETELEDEIRWEESRSQPREVIGRVRRRCEEVLHCKSMLLFVVVLNVIDCVLVMGELTMDFHHVSYRFISQRDHKDEFVDRMKGLYPDALASLNKEPVTDMYNRLLASFVVWNSSFYTSQLLHADCSHLMNVLGNVSSSGTTGKHTDTLTSFTHWMSSISADGVQVMGEVPKEAYDTVKVAHALHYASISILSVLVIETLLKILCTGRRFLRKRMEVFDAVIIFISFVLDIIFVEGLTDLKIQSFVVILSFLLPWRILRVLNSLVVAVMDQHRFHMKLLYKQKRKVTKHLSESTDKIRVLEKQVEVLRNMCMQKGAHEWEVKKALGQTQNGNGGLSGMNALSKLVFQAADAFAPMSSVQLNGGPDNARAGNSKIGISRSLENTKLTDRSSSSSNGVGHRAGGSKDIEFLESADSDRDNSGGTSSERRSSQDGTTPTFYVPTDEPVTVEPVTVDVTTTVIDETDTLSTRL